MPDNVLIRCFFENNGGSEKTLKKSDSLARTRGQREMADKALLRCFFGDN